MPSTSGWWGAFDKWGEPGARVPPCPSNAFTIGKTRRNKKRGTLTVEVTVPGPGSLVGEAGRKMKATVPQPVAAESRWSPSGLRGRASRRSPGNGPLKGSLALTFTPPNGDPNTQRRKIKLVKKRKKKQRSKAKGKR